jgi:repressor LexA
MREIEFKQFEKMVMPIYRKEFARRLKQSMVLNEIKQVDLVERTGINKSKISSYCAGRYMPKSENLTKIADVLNVNAAWLMGIDIEEQTIKPRKIPILGNIAAGKPLFAEENIEGYDYAPMSNMCEDHNYFFLRVKGDSMNLKFNEGDLVLVQQQNYLEQRRDWCFPYKWRMGYC